MRAFELQVGDTIKLVDNYEIKINDIINNDDIIEVWGIHSVTKEKVRKYILSDYDVECYRRK